jgi:hypothetical protein
MRGLACATRGHAARPCPPAELPRGSRPPFRRGLSAGRRYQQTFVDTYAKVGFAKLYESRPRSPPPICSMTGSSRSTRSTASHSAACSPIAAANTVATRSVTNDLGIPYCRLGLNSSRSRLDWRPPASEATLCKTQEDGQSSIDEPTRVRHWLSICRAP